MAAAWPASRPGYQADFGRAAWRQPASYALRFAAGFSRNIMVLSGMSDLAQMEENTAFCRISSP